MPKLTSQFHSAILSVMTSYIAWEEAEVTAQNRSEWGRNVAVAQRIHLDGGGG